MIELKRKSRQVMLPRRLLWRLIIAILLLLPHSIHLNAQEFRQARPVGLTPQSPQPAATTASPTIRETTQAQPQFTQPTINQGAGSGKKSQDMGQMVNSIASIGLFAACMAAGPEGYPLCMMGQMAASQAGQMASASGKSKATFDASRFNQNGLGTAGTAGSVDGGEPPAPDFMRNPTVQAGLKKLSDAGYQMTDEGFVGPDGKLTPFSSLQSPSAMSSAGFSDKSVALAKSTLDKLNKDIGDLGPRVITMGVESSGGGSAFAGKSYGDDSPGDDSPMMKFHDPFALESSAKQRMIAGKSVSVGGEPIGVKMDNIFDMVHRCYQKKRQAREFIEAAQRN